jgi:hypothetical protein
MEVDGIADYQNEVEGEIYQHETPIRDLLLITLLFLLFSAILLLHILICR